MIVKTKFSSRYRRRFCLFLLLGVMFSSIVVSADAQKTKKSDGQSLTPPSDTQRRDIKQKVGTRSIQSSVPSGYTRLEGTELYYSRKMGGVFVGSLSVGSIDLLGKFGDQYYSSTYGDYGYVVAIKVDNNTASFADCLNGSTHNGVTFRADIEPQGEMARMYYTVTNTNDYDVNVSLGAYDDVYVGDNIAASITRKKDTLGNTYGISLSDGGGAQLCVLFGSGLAGVTGVDDFWFGSYNLNATAEAVACNYSTGNNYMVENGNYDCGIGWGWKNRLIKAGQTTVFSYLIAIGDVNLEPNSNYEVTPEDPEGWNDLSRLHVLTLEGDYESPAGLNGRIEYAVEDSEEWIALTEMIESGSTFTGEVRAMFDPTLSRHTIRFRTVDQVGNTSLLPSIVYPDVAFHALGGVVEKTYTGEPIYQTDVTCDLGKGKYELKNYQNNVNVGTASFNIEGVFPYTIGRKTYNFTINPAPLAGGITLETDSYVYDGQAKTPDWSFTEEAYAALEFDKDYTFEWSNNTLPGTATLTVSGKGNYAGTLSQTFLIDKAPLTADLYEVTIPGEDVCFDEATHGASIIVSEGVGLATITYQKDGNILNTAPSEPGSYDVYLEIADGSLYYGLTNQIIGSFTIYQFDETDWQNLQTLRDQLVEQGWQQPWDLSQGAKSASTLSGLSIEQGRIVGLDLSSLGLTGGIPSAVTGFPAMKSLNLSGNSLSGNIGGLFTDNALPNLNVLQASDNHFSEISPILPSTITTLDLTGQEIDQVITVDASAFSLEQIPSLLLYNHAAQSYHTVQALQLTNYPPTATDYDADKPFWGFKAIGLDSSTPQLTCLSDNNTYYGQSGDILYYTYPSASDEVAGSFCQFQFNFDKGDVNMFGGVDILDLQAMISYMFEEYANRPFNYTAANLWQDNVINVQDAVLLVNILLEKNSSSGTRTRTSVPENGNDAEAVVYCQNGKICLKTTKEIAAFDIIVSGCSAVEVTKDLEQYGLTCSVRQSGNSVHLVGYSLSKGCLPQGEIIIGSLAADGTPYVCDAALSDSNAMRVSAARNLSDLTGIRTAKKNGKVTDIRYRLSLGHNHAIMIDAKGKKTIK